MSSLLVVKIGVSQEDSFKLITKLDVFFFKKKIFCDSLPFLLGRLKDVGKWHASCGSSVNKWQRLVYHPHQGQQEIEKLI